MRGERAPALVGAATWAGLALLLLGLVLGIFPLLPVETPQGPMQGVPHMPWTAAGIAVAGVILMLWARARDRSR